MHYCSAAGMLLCIPEYQSLAFKVRRAGCWKGRNGAAEQAAAAHVASCHSEQRHAKFAHNKA